MNQTLPAPQATYDPHPRELGGLLKRHRAFILGCMLLSAAVGVAYSAFTRPKYDASAVIRYEAERVDLPQLVQVLSTENIIGTEIGVLRGRAAAVAVIDSLSLRARLQAPRTARITSLFSTLRVSAAADTGTLVLRRRADGAYAVSGAQPERVLGVARIGDTTRIAGVLMALAPAARDVPTISLHIDALDDAVRRFESGLKVSRPARDADLIAIHVRMGDPALAAASANLLAGNLLADRRASRRGSTDAAVAYLERQDDSLGRQLRAAEDSLRRYRQGAHVIDVPQQASAEVARLAKLQADLAGVRAERDAFGTLVTQLRRDAAGAPGEQGISRKLMAFPSLLSNQTASVLLGALAQAEGERATLLIRRTPADSDVQVLTHRTREIETQLQGVAESYLQGLTNQVSALQGEAGRFRAQLDVLPEKELQTARLERDTKVLNDLWVLVRTRLKEAQVTGAAGDPAMRVVDAAVVPDRPVSPKPLLAIPLSLFLGAIVGVSASLLREATDRSVRSRGDALAAGGLQVVGALPRVPHPARLIPSGIPSAKALLKTSGHSASEERARTAASLASLLITRPGTPPAYTESLNQLFVNLALAYRSSPAKVIVFTSPLPGEGKSLTSINFALVGALRGLRVLLIDADLRCGVVSSALGVGRAVGFAELLTGSARVDEAVHAVSLPDAEKLFVMPAGVLRKAPGRVLAIDRLQKTLASLTPSYDVVVIDTPPVNLLADAGVLGSVADAVLLVVRAGHTQAEDLRYAMEQLEAMRAPVVGTLLNDIDLQRNARDDGSYRYLAEAGRYHVSTP